MTGHGRTSRGTGRAGDRGTGVPVGVRAVPAEFVNCLKLFKLYTDKMVGTPVPSGVRPCLMVFWSELVFETMCLIILKSGFKTSLDSVDPHYILVPNSICFV